MWDHPYEPPLVIREPRLLVRPAQRLSGLAPTEWTISGSGISASAAGTYYTAWMQLTGAPLVMARGWFSFPDSAISVIGTGSGDAYLELGRITSGGSGISGSGSGFKTGIHVGSMALLDAGGMGTRSAACSALITMDSSERLEMVRWKLVLDGARGEWAMGSSPITQLT